LSFCDGVLVTPKKNLYLVEIEVCIPQSGKTDYLFQVYTGKGKDLWKPEHIQFTAQENLCTQKVTLPKPLLLEAGKPYSVNCEMYGRSNMVRYIYKEGKGNYSDENVTIDFGENRPSGFITALVFNNV
jgi:hypothetical protein